MTFILISSIIVLNYISAQFRDRDREGMTHRKERRNRLPERDLIHVEKE